MPSSDSRRLNFSLPAIESFHLLRAIYAIPADQFKTTLDELVASTGWLPHTTRAALTGLRRRGYAVSIDRSDKRIGRDGSGGPIRVVIQSIRHWLMLPHDIAGVLV